MIGVFDSGEGGRLTLAHLRRLAPRCDLCFLADTENAPYGTKTVPELVGLVSSDIERLRAAGADEILIACCTASTVYPHLSDEVKRNAHPIIAPSARAAAKVSASGRIGVIATRATVASHAFKRELERLECVCVFEHEAQELVGLVEGGMRDGSATENEIKAVQIALEKIKTENIDTLILGCTHFPLISEVISNIMGEVRLISSAYEGALEILRRADTVGTGKTLYL